MMEVFVGFDEANVCLGVGGGLCCGRRRWLRALRAPRPTPVLCHGIGRYMPRGVHIVQPVLPGFPCGACFGAPRYKQHRARLRAASLRRAGVSFGAFCSTVGVAARGSGPWALLCGQQSAGATQRGAPWEAYQAELMSDGPFGEGRGEGGQALWLSLSNFMSTMLANAANNIIQPGVIASQRVYSCTCECPSSLCGAM